MLRDTADASTHPAVRLFEVSKRFHGTQALHPTTLAIESGEVHALVGENGAGKSTLGKILMGSYRPDEGTIEVYGEPVRFRSPAGALAHGITGISQEVSLVPELSVQANVFLGLEDGRFGFTNRTALRRRYAELCERTGFDIPGDVPVGSLRIAEQQRVEILRALARRAKVIVMDEPTAALSASEIEKLHDVIRGLKRAGTTVIFVSHFLKEVLALSDRVSVLRDGRLVRTGQTCRESEASLVLSMVGRSLTNLFPPRRPPAEDAPVLLKVQNLTRGTAFRDVSFHVRAGEIVGLAGLIGAGRTEVARAVFGADHVDSGEIFHQGRALRARGPRDALARGICYVTESRGSDGLVLEQSVSDNVVLPNIRRLSRWGFLRRSRERQACREILSEVHADVENLDRPVGALSGGNQQKVLLARWLYANPSVLIVDEPTRGVDIGAKVSVYQLIADASARGTAVIVVSSDQEEVVGLAHRIFVMRTGSIVAELSGEDMTEAQVLNHAFGQMEDVS